jgi:rubrerythrin
MMPRPRRNQSQAPEPAAISTAAAQAATRAALMEAIEDEYKARATYRAVIAAFGPVRPFINIVESEDRHVIALTDLFRRRGLMPPEDTWMGRVAAPASIAQACRDAVAAEIENGAMYERLLEIVGDADVRRVLRNLRLASQENHLPAFRRCLTRMQSRDLVPATPRKSTQQCRR